MMKRLREFVRRIWERYTDSREVERVMLGRMLAEQYARRESVAALPEVEFKVFSQFGDDGIIQWLTRVVDFPSKVFIEFGVEDYRESNTRFLMINNNWAGLVIDGSAENIARITGADYFWRHNLVATAAFIDRDNIENLIAAAELPGDVGILHIDLDGNDYWIWERITAIRPVLVIVEYNWVFGCERPITVPYDPEFVRGRKHFSNLYFGASLGSLCLLAEKKGYIFIGTNGAGNNAYFIRRESMVAGLPQPSLAEGYVAASFREARAENGQLTFLRGSAQLEVIRGLPVWNVATNELERL